ncbi:adenylate/guanylate cyclase domain-containing protein [Actinotalea sp. M2MS4P-6]|uniref:adenylate/guanylate cyclase domain-containing protein n=1 Tax=Actinotalea sp. M2MS4P-6 TaxID=2983762 RepID=UPI0021E462E0|nr:adenylate/guanylate cyclase domain-containing protein [Actinotalea sp. M2MS4P-6]MCV2393521.1 adenylate/guanylate cyclase domain-containing protein [Actinotalea sp. M2MS4P-6]
MAESHDAGLPPDLVAALAALDDALLGGPRDLTVEDVARLAHVREDEVRTFWHALGLHLPGAGEAGFTAADAEVIGAFVGASREFDLRPDAGVSLVRAMGHSVERLVAWQSETIIEHLVGRYGIRDSEARRLLLDRMLVVSGLLEKGLVHAWRRHVAAIALRTAANADLAAPDDDELPLTRAVGLADVVGFTTRTAHLGAAALAEYVQGFEARARDVVTEHGGRVIKTVGDAILFVADDPATGAEVALGLVRAFGPETDAPLRAGLVWGRVLSRFGDIFGPSVSLASRLCDEAGPGRVLVDEVTAANLAGRFLLEPLEAREVAGIGELRPSLLIAEG